MSYVRLLGEMSDIFERTFGSVRNSGEIFENPIFNSFLNATFLEAAFGRRNSSFSL